MKLTKLLLIGLLAILLTGCEKYRYDVTYEKCNGKTGNTSYVDFDSEPNTTQIKSPVPVFYYKGGKIIDVCDFSYTKTLIQDNQ